MQQTENYPVDDEAKKSESQDDEREPENLENWLEKGIEESQDYSSDEIELDPACRDDFGEKETQTIENEAVEENR